MKSRLTALILLCLFGLSGKLPGGQSSAAEEPLTVAREWPIRIPSSPHRALVRAATDLQAFLRERHGFALNVVEGGSGPGIALAVDEKQKDDRFSLRAVPAKQQVIVEGSSPRAVYQGVLLLEDRLAESQHVAPSLDETVVFPFKERNLIWNALLTGQNKGAIGFDLERHVREAVRLGYTGMECNRFVGMKLIQQGHPRDIGVKIRIAIFSGSGYSWAWSLCLYTPTSGTTFGRSSHPIWKKPPRR